MAKFNVIYYQCDYCGFIQTEDPYWLEEAYLNAISSIDTGIIVRNQKMTDAATIIIRSYFNKNFVYLDYAGGYGLFCRMIRDNGFDFYWFDPICENIFSKGFEHKQGTFYNLVTCFEGFEHFPNPLDEIEKIFTYSENILFSTLLLPKQYPKPGDWWYYAFESGQHISFYTRKSLEELAKHFGKYLYTNNRNLHLITGRKLINGIFSLITKVAYVIPSSIISLGLKSKTNSDMDFLAGR